MIPQLQVERPKESLTMKHNHNHDNANNVVPQLVPVRFEFTHPTATTVCVADGKWMPDPLARETVANPFGGRNSILTVASSPEVAHLANAEKLSLKSINNPKSHKI